MSTKPTSSAELYEAANVMPDGPAKDAVTAAAVKQKVKESGAIAATKRVFKGPKRAYDSDPAKFVEVRVGDRIFNDTAAHIAPSINDSTGLLKAWLRVRSTEVIAISPKLDKLATSRNYGGGNPDYREAVGGELSFADAYNSVLRKAQAEVAATELKLTAEKALLAKVIAMRDLAINDSPETLEVEFYFNPATGGTSKFKGPEYLAPLFEPATHGAEHRHSNRDTVTA